jgi:hypothetical protein
VGDGEFAFETEGGACLQMLWQQFPWQKMRVYCPGRYFIPNRLASNLTPEDIIQSLQLPADVLSRCIWARHLQPSSSSSPSSFPSPMTPLEDPKQGEEEEETKETKKKKDDITVLFFPCRGGLMTYKKLSPPPRPKKQKQPRQPKRRRRSNQTCENHSLDEDRKSEETRKMELKEETEETGGEETIYIHTLNTHSGLRRKLLALGLQAIWEQGPHP